MAYVKINKDDSIIPFKNNDIDIDDVDLNPVRENGKSITADIDYLDTWRAMEQLMKTGKIRSLGMSNFNSQQIDRLLAVANIRPVTNQIECHPNFNQHKLIKFCTDRNITVTAYSPLGRPHSGSVNLAINDPKVNAIAQAHNKSSSQVVLRYTVSIYPKLNTNVRQLIPSHILVPKWSYCHSKIDEQGPHQS